MLVSVVLSEKVARPVFPISPHLSVADKCSLECWCADVFLVFGLSLAPILIWGLRMTRCEPCQTQPMHNFLTTSFCLVSSGRLYRKLQTALSGHEVVGSDDAASDTADEPAPSPPASQPRQNRGPPGR